MRRTGEIEILARGVLVREEKVLLCRAEGAAHTYLPGGHVEFMERAAAALGREIREELGWRIAVGRFLGAVEHTFVQAARRRCELNLVFELVADGAEPGREPRSREAGIGFEWAPLNALAGGDLEPRALRTLLPGWLQQKDPLPRWGSTYRASSPAG